jgi:hypothetical protein
VVYLLILVGVAAAGLLRLWVAHRRDQRNRYADMEGLVARLERVSARRPLGYAPTDRPTPLEPTRRAAARRRIEERRRRPAG